MCYEVMECSCIQYFIRYPVGQTDSTQDAIREIVHALSYPILFPIIGRLTHATGSTWDIASQVDATGCLMDMITESAASHGLHLSMVTLNVLYMVTHVAALEYTITMQECCT